MAQRANTVLCADHGKKRYIHDMLVENGLYRCMPTKQCRLDAYHTQHKSVIDGVPQQPADGFTSAPVAGGVSIAIGSSTAISTAAPTTHGGGGREAEVCSVHGKKRLIVDLVPVEGGGGWRCVATRQCRDDNMKCRRHQKMRFLADLDQLPNGEYECKPGRICYTHQDGVGAKAGGGMFNTSGETTGVFIPNGLTLPPVDGSIRIGEGIQITVGNTTLNPGMYRVHGARNALGGVGTDVWCHLHGKRIHVSRSERVDDAFNCCRDKNACLSSALDSIDVLMTMGCTEVVCAVHGALRGVQYMTLYDDRSYRCLEDHPCTGTSSQQMVAKLRR